MHRVILSTVESKIEIGIGTNVILIHLWLDLYRHKLYYSTSVKNGGSHQKISFRKNAAEANNNINVHMECAVTIVFTLLNI